MAALYDIDFQAWTKAQVDALRRRSVDELDWDNILEEISSLGISQRRELRNRLRLLQVHLLKWTYQPDGRGRSWRLTVREQRRQIQDLLADNPSLQSTVEAVMLDVYSDAREDAALETGLAQSDFPPAAPFSFEDAMTVELPTD